MSLSPPRKVRKRPLPDDDIDDDDDEDDAPPSKRQKRLQKNRESAARSREKKARLFKEMQVQVSELTEKNNQLTRTLALLTNQCESMNAIRDENRDLRDKLHKLELQIARTEMENRNLRAQCGGADSGGARLPSPPPIVTDNSDNTGPGTTNEENNQVSVPLPPISAVSLNSFPTSVRFPGTPATTTTNESTHNGPNNQPPNMAQEQQQQPESVNRQVEELTQLLLHRPPSNGVCTTSVPSCLPVQLYTCANTNNKNPAPKYYNPTGGMPTNEYLAANSRGQFGFPPGLRSHAGMPQQGQPLQSSYNGWPQEYS